ncbi:MAG TPA: ElyC/SanA/YdcF family protein [Anaerolineae bacterium]|nr:ElyC/SanA/YdcF family protein [Anaerolineae bacterium]
MSRYIALFKRIVALVMIFGVVAMVMPFGLRWGIERYYGQYIYTAEGVPETRVAVVFGAGLNRSGGPSAVLRDRMEVAIGLYEAGRVDKLLLSGDNRFENYDEPTAMWEYAVARGVAEGDLQRDFAGRRTYDTCYRAKHIFQVDEAILITQGFHLPRALFTCRQLGVEAVGVASDLQSYIAVRWFELREVAATVRAAWDVVWAEPAPIMGEPIPIE